MESAIIWRGKSLLDWTTDIVVVVTGIKHKSGNAKTGAMVQTYILVDDTKPKAAIDDGTDAAICGDCPHRKQADGSRSCYVNLATGLNVVGRQMLAGAYEERSLDEVAQACAGLPVRLGTYGDPAAVPAYVWRALVSQASSHTGYTHQWRKPHAAAYVGLLMASCDSEADRVAAKAQGWRTFRVRAVSAAGAVDPMAAGEIVCPASFEAGKRTTCERCGLCAGASKGPKVKDIAIINHSVTARAAVKRAARLTVLQ